MADYNFDQHINFRRESVSKANINNPSFPGLSVVEINPTELCNRTCSFCPRSNPEVYPNLNLHMSLGTAQKISDQLFEYGYDGQVSITGFGEPTLNKLILELIKIFSQRFRTSMITNGDNILSGKVPISSIIESGLSILIVDCYDGDKHYSKIYELLLPYKDKIDYKIRNTFDDGSSTVFSDLNFNNRGGILGEVESLTKPCHLPMYKAMIDWNGDVLLCCNDWSRKEKGLGNINREHFQKLWVSTRLNSIRKSLIKGRRKDIAACKGCDVEGTLVGKESLEIFKNKLS